MTRRNTCPLALETLEGRTCPAVDAFITANAVVLIGTQGATGDTVDLDWGAGGQLTVTYSTAGGNQTVNFTGKTRAVVKLAGLDDTVSVRISADQTKAIKVTAELGGGDDSFLFGVQGQGVAIRSDVRLHVKGGAGDDRVVLQDSPDVFGVRFLVQAKLGSGDDTFVGSVGALGVGIFSNPAFADFLVNGGVGDDSIHVLAGGPGSEIAGVGRLSVLARGGAGDDFINADCSYMDSTTRTSNVVLDGEQGDDVIVADFEQLSGGSAGSILANLFNPTVRGGSGDDDLTLWVHNGVRTGLLDGGTGIDMGFGHATTVMGCEFVDPL